MITIFSSHRCSKALVPALAALFFVSVLWSAALPHAQAAKFVTGERVRTKADLNIRSSPSLSGTLLGLQSEGALGTVIGGPTTADNYTWWNINFDTGVDGWGAENYLASTAFNFSLAPTQSSVSIPQGQTTSNTITATLSSIKSESVSYAASGFPTGVTTSFTLKSCIPTCTTTLILATAASTPVGTYTVTVTGTADSYTTTTSFTLTVNPPPPSLLAPTPPPPPPPTFTTLSVSPTTVATGGNVTATWSTVQNPTVTDWIGLYIPGAPDDSANLKDWKYTSSCTQTAGSTAKASGSCTFSMPTTLGTYELRLFPSDLYSPRLAISPTITVQSSPPPPPPSPTPPPPPPPAPMEITYTVSTSGNNSNPCTAGVTFLTIQRAADCATAGQKIYVRAGTYYERVVLPRSGASGSPIIIEGERGAGGEYLAIVDGTTLVSPNWIPATSGDGFSSNGSSYPTVWKMTNPGYIAWGLSVNGKNTMRIPDRYMNGELPISSIQPQLNGKDKLKQAANATCTHGGYSANCWDGKEVLWGNAGGQVFIRFRNGDNPNGKTIGLSPGRVSKSSIPSEGATFKIADQDYIVLSNMQIRGGDVGVLIRGTSDNNIIENNLITRGHARVFVYGPAQNNLIRNNTLHSDMYGYGLADSSYVPNTDSGYAGIVSRHLYYEDKFYPGESTEDDTGVWFAGNAVGTQVYGNLIEYGNGQGIKMANGSVNTKVSGNTIRFNAAQGIFMAGSNDGLQLYDNLIHNNSYNVRWNEDGSSGTAYIYRNRLWNSSGGNNNFFFGLFNPATSFGSTLYFYHNSMAGQKAISLSGVSGSGDVWPNSYWVNNIFSTYVSGETTPETVNAQNDIGCFDRNWLQGPNFYNANPPPWYDANNVDGATELWGDITLPDFQLTSASPARTIGYDVSQSWNCRGVSRAALPGFSSGYFSGTRPDAGALQFGAVITPPPPPPSPTPPPPPPPPAPTPPPPPPPAAKFIIGDRVQTTATLNVRSAPSGTATILGTQPPEALGTVIGGPTSANGYIWWQINYDNAPDGWSVEDYLVKVVTSPPPPPPPSPTPPPPPPVTPPPPPAPTGLIIHYKLNETSGTIASDSAGTNHGTLINSPAWTTGGKVGGALNFQRTSLQHIKLNTGLITAYPLSLCAWFKSNDSSNSQGLLTIDTSQSGDESAFRIMLRGDLATKKVEASVRNSTGNVNSALTSNGYSINTWHHVCGTFASGTNGLSIYMDGALKGTGNGNQTPTNLDAIYVGRSHNESAYFSGLSDEIKIYNRVLSASEVQQLYAGAVTPPPPPPSPTPPPPPPPPAPTPPPPPPPAAKFIIGDRVQTTATLNVRSAPSGTATILGTQPPEALGTVIGGPTSANGYIWWQINYDNAPDGWSVEDYLVKALGPSLSVSPTIVAPGGSVTASWSGVQNPTVTDWIGLYIPGAPDDGPNLKDWKYTSNCTQTPGSIAKASGSCIFSMPTIAGTYEMRLFPSDLYSPRLATSPTITVQ